MLGTGISIYLSEGLISDGLQKSQHFNLNFKTSADQQHEMMAIYFVNLLFWIVAILMFNLVTITNLWLVNRISKLDSTR